MKNIVLFVLSWLVFLNISAQPQAEPFSVGLEYYMPSQWTYELDKSITTPKEFLGYELGSQHVEWNQVVEYMRMLARESKRFSVKTYGHTYEHRPFVCVAITSPGNQEHLDEIRTNHLKTLRGEKDNGPVIISVGSTIHGNEPSGVNGSIAVAYFLAAAQGPEIEQMLKETVILLIPGLNPDGLNRFASWVNSSRLLSNVSDVSSREFREAGPSSRLNHYWHDCNRDWLFLEHPEARFGVEVYHEWMPHVLSDHHEMGSDKTLFFSPGDANRVHYSIPTNNQAVTGEVTKYIAQSLDKLGSKYFTLRGYDDFYLGKGAAYGDVQGSVCILVEQASSRGHYRMTANGLLTFPFTVRNQSAAQFSIIYGAWKERKLLQNYMTTFYQNLLKQDSSEGILFTAAASKSVTWQFLQLMRQHKIHVYKVKGGLNNKQIKADYFIPFKGNNPALIQSIMDKNTSEFGDSLFYDISAWTIPYAYGIDWEKANGNRLVLEEITDVSFPKGKVEGTSAQDIYQFSCKEFYTPSLVYSLQQQGYSVWAKSGELYTCAPQKVVAKEAQRTGIDFTAVHSLDTTNLNLLRNPKIGIVMVNHGLATTLGTFLYLLDYKYQMQPSIIDATQLTSANLSEYNTLIIASPLPNDAICLEKVKKWIENGGILIACNASHSTLLKLGMTSLIPKKYSTQKKNEIKGGFPGGILEIQVKKASPLTWGITHSAIPVFKMGTTMFKENSNSICNFSEKPLSGYFAESPKQAIANTPAVLMQKMGGGNVIYFNFSVNFRSYWYSTTQLFNNAMLFGNLQ